MQRLRAAQNRGHRLDRGADDVVVRILLLQAYATGLAVRAQHFRLFGLRPQPFHHFMPKRTARAHLGDFHEKVHADAPEEGQARCEGVDIQPRFHRTLRVFLAVSDCEGQFLHRRGPSLVHVIARDRNAVEFRHVGRGVCDDVRNDPHTRFGRVDISIADHELL